MTVRDDIAIHTSLRPLGGLLSVTDDGDDNGLVK